MHPTQDPPAGWPAPRRTVGRVLSAAFLTLVTAAMAVVAVAAAATGDVLPAVVFGLSAVLGGHIVGLAVGGLRSPQQCSDVRVAGETDRGEKGLAFPYARAPYYWLSVILGLVVLLAGGFAVVVAAAGTVTGWVVAAVAGGLAVLTGWFLAVVLRLAPGTVVLTPTGIYHRSLVLEHFVPWDAVVDIRPREGTNPWIIVRATPKADSRERKHTGRLGAFESQALPFMIIRARWLGGNAFAAYRVLRHYLERPDQRSQLSGIAQDVNR